MGFCDLFPWLCDDSFVGGLQQDPLIAAVPLLLFAGIRWRRDRRRS